MTLFSVFKKRLCGLQRNAMIPLKDSPANFSLPEGSSKVIAANMPAYSHMLFRFKKNPISPGWHEILIIRSGQIHYMDIAYKDLFHISGNDLAVKNASKVLTGFYQLAYQLNLSCVQQFSLQILSPWHCSSTNFSLAEGCEMIIANMSTNSSVLTLYKKDNFSSDWEHILNITNGLLSYIRKEYKGLFLTSEDHLVIKNVTERLIGEYQLVGGDNETCVKQFFLEVAGSEAAGNSAYLKIGVSILVPVLVLLMVLWALYLHCKRRRVGNRNEVAYRSAKILSAENGSLEHNISRRQGTEMDRQTQEIQ